jgi:cob(I)alamin adenosyltransferase
MSEPTKPSGNAAFDDPNIAINRVYTKKGDRGQTSLVGGQKVDKSDARIEAYGTVDELNAFVGAARQSADEALRSLTGEARSRMEHTSRALLRVQHELFNLGSILATLPEDVHPRQPRVTEVEVTALERDIDLCQEVLAPLRSFVLPGGTRLNVDLHVARTVCRRAERLLVGLSRSVEVEPSTVRYLNRLSDALFVWSRYASHVLGAPETLWRPNEAASGLEST